MARSKMTAGYKNTHGLILKKSSDGPMLRTLPTSAQWGPSSDQPAALSVGCRVWLYQRTSKCTRQSSKQRQFALFPRTVAGFHPSQATPHATCVFPPRFHLRPLRLILFLKLPGLRGPLPVATTHHYHVRPTIRVTIQVLPVSGADRAVVGQRAPGVGHAWVPREWVAAHPSHSCCRRCGHSLPPYQTGGAALAAPSRASGGHSRVLRSAVVALFLIDRQPRYQVLHAAVARPPATSVYPSCSALRTTCTPSPLLACTIPGTPLPPTAVTLSPPYQHYGCRGRP